MKIERPDWYEVLEIKTIANIYKTHLNRAWDKAIEPINKMLSEGVEVYARVPDLDHPTVWVHDHRRDDIDDTHKALLIGITEIKEDTVEGILKEYIENSEDKWPIEEYERWRTRAKKLLDKK